jgi:hypothetical protein
LGGLKLGFINVGYQVVMAERVTIPEKYPTTKQVTTTTRILEILFIFISYFLPKLIKTLIDSTNKEISIFAQIL